MNSTEDCNLKASAHRIRTDDEKAGQIGEILAIALNLKKDKERKDRYITDWGAKTAAGVARIVLRILEEEGHELLHP